MVYLAKSEVKILKYIRRHPNCTYSEIYRNYPEFKCCFSKFEYQRLITSNDPNDNLMGNEYEDLNNPTIISIAHDGIVYLDSRRWFNFEFFVKEFLLPITVSIITTLITLYLTGTLTISL